MRISLLFELLQSARCYRTIVPTFPCYPKRSLQLQQWPKYICSSPVTVRDLTPDFRSQESLPSDFNDRKYVREIFKCSEREAPLLDSEYIRWESEQSLHSKVANLKAAGISEKIILNNPYVLRNNLPDLRKKIQDLKSCRIPLNQQTVILLACPSMRMLIKTYRPDYYQRIDYLSQELEVDYNTLFNMVHKKHMKLLTVSLPKLQAIVRSFKGVGVTSTALKNDLWVFYASYNLAKERLEEAKALNMPVKTWMGRCGMDIFLKSTIKWQNMMEVFGAEADHIDFLVQKLECDRQTVERMLQLHDVKGGAPQKLRQTIDYLLSVGYTREDIIDSPRILVHDLQRTKERHLRLKAFGLRPKRLRTFTLTDTAFNKLIERFEVRGNLRLFIRLNEPNDESVVNR